MERFYTFDGTIVRARARARGRTRALRLLPGHRDRVGAAWRLLPRPFDDFRVFVLLMTLAGFAAAMAFRAPLGWRLVIGALVVANPIAVRSAWFGQNDAPSITLMVLAFALASRGRYRWAAASLAGAVLLKQFAVVAIPFLALMMLKRGSRGTSSSAAPASSPGWSPSCVLPFLIADPVAFYEDTVKFGAGTYKIVGYGLSAMLIRAGILEDRDGSYPFALIAVLTWLPLTAWLLRPGPSRAGAVGLARPAFSISILVLLFIGRTFNNYYLVWPMMGAAVAALLYAGDVGARPTTSPSERERAPSLGQHRIAVLEAGARADAFLRPRALALVAAAACDALRPGWRSVAAPWRPRSGARRACPPAVRSRSLRGLERVPRAAPA